MSFALTFAFAFAFDHALAAFAAFPSTFAVFAFAADAFAFTWGAESNVFVLAILNTVRVSDVHVDAVLIGARHGGL